jgi:hypothetical protein
VGRRSSLVMNRPVAVLRLTGLEFDRVKGHLYLPAVQAARDQTIATAVTGGVPRTVEKDGCGLR